MYILLITVWFRKFLLKTTTHDIKILEYIDTIKNNDTFLYCVKNIAPCLK